MADPEPGAGGESLHQFTQVLVLSKTQLLLQPNGSFLVGGHGSDCLIRDRHMIALGQQQRPIGLLDPEACAHSGMQQQLLSNTCIVPTSLPQALLDGISAVSELPEVVLNQVALADPEPS